MGSIERRDRQKKELKRLILDTAMAMIAREGYENFTMRALAERIEYSPRTIYLHFAGKEALMDGIGEEVFSRTLASMEAAGHSPYGNVGPEEILSQQIDRHIRTALSHPHLYGAVVKHLGEKLTEPGPREKRFEEKVVTVLSCSPEKGEIFLSSLRAAALLALKKGLGPKGEDTDKFIAQFTEFCIGGIL